MTDFGQLYLYALSEIKENIDQPALDNFCGLINNHARIFTLGKGRTGLVMDMFAMRLIHLGKSAYPIGKPATPKVGAGDLVVLASGSGKTPALLQTADQAKEIGAQLAVICGSEKSPLSQKTRHILYIPVDEAIPAGYGANKVLSGTIFEQSLLVTLDGLVGMIMEDGGQNFADLSARHANLE